MPNRDIQWLIGTMVVLAGLLVWRIDAGFAGVNARIDDVRSELAAQISGVNARIDGVNARIGDGNARMDRIDERMDRIDERMDRIDERLRNMEIALGKVAQRLLTIERVVLPAPDQPGA